MIISQLLTVATITTPRKYCLVFGSAEDMNTTHMNTQTSLLFVHKQEGNKGQLTYIRVHTDHNDTDRFNFRPPASLIENIPLRNKDQSFREIYLVTTEMNFVRGLYKPGS